VESKLPIEVVGQDVSDEFRENVDSVLENLPEKVAAKLSEKKHEIKLAHNATEAYPEIVGDKMRGWPDDATWDDVEGFFVPELKTTNVFEYIRDGEGGWRKNYRDSSFTIAHELGHALDDALDDISSKKKFRDAYYKDIKTLSEKDIIVSGYFTQEGEAGRQETFAELFSTMFSGGYDVSGMQRRFPGATKALKEIIKDI